MLTNILVLLGALQLAAGQVPTAITDPPPVFTTTPRTTATTSCPVVCVDYINPCGQMYGGCGPRCPGAPLPTYPAPSCSKTTTISTTTPYVPPTTTTSSTTARTSCPTLCIDYINSCGGMWGTCVPRCPGTPLPTYTPPPCTPRSTTVTTTSSRPTTTSRGCPTICVDFMNSCGGMWGTCVPTCSGTPLPTFTPPPCTPRSTTTGVPVNIFPAWSQCGGLGFTQTGVCASGYKCYKYNDYYHQCIPV